MTNIDKWLTDRLNSLGMSKVDFANKFGILKQHVNRLEQVKPKLSPSQFESLSKILKCDFDGLQLFWDNKITEKDLWNYMVKSGVSIIYKVGYVQAGQFNEAFQLPDDEWEEIPCPINDNYNGKPIFALGVRGDSMDKVFPPNRTTLICCPIEDWGKEPENGDYVIIYRKDEAERCEATVKRFYKISDDEYILRPESTNEEFFDIRLTKNSYDYQIHAIVIDYMTKLKEL